MHDLLFEGKASCASHPIANRVSKPPGQLTLDLGIEIATDATACKWLKDRGANASSAVVALIHSAASDDWRPRASVLGPYVTDLERWVDGHIRLAPKCWLRSADLTAAFIAHLQTTSLPYPPDQILRRALANAIWRRWRICRWNCCPGPAGAVRGFYGLRLVIPDSPPAPPANFRSAGGGLCR